MSNPIKIDQKIVGYSVVQDAAPAAPEPVPAPAPLPPPAPAPTLLHERPEVVHGSTYKIKPPTGDSAIYITVNNIELPDGTLRPIEVFINTKDIAHAQWMTGLTRVISALLRKPGEYAFIFDELMQVFDPSGGYFKKGKMIPSVVADIGHVLREHCKRLGVVKGPELSPEQRELIDKKASEAKAKGVKGSRCGKCNEDQVVVLDGCMTCLNCGDSKCG